MSWRFIIQQPSNTCREAAQIGRSRCAVPKLSQRVTWTLTHLNESTFSSQSYTNYVAIGYNFRVGMAGVGCPGQKSRTYRKVPPLPEVTLPRGFQDFALGHQRSRTAPVPCALSLSSTSLLRTSSVAVIHLHDQDECCLRGSVISCAACPRCCLENTVLHTSSLRGPSAAAGRFERLP